tara:strand:+ start:183 stop:422 length:240 start_codon:yes stop_codon:yes gene_type:complete
MTKNENEFPPPTNKDMKNNKTPIDHGQSSRGIGDTISKLIKTLTAGRVEECEPCRKRKEKLNKIMPYKKRNDENEVQDN